MTLKQQTAPATELLVILLAVAAIVTEAPRAVPGGWLWDFGSFVASGRAAAEGLNPFGVYPLTFRVSMPGFEAANPNLNPPISALLFQAFDVVDPHLGFRLWLALSLVAYAAAVWLLLRRYGTFAAPALLVLPFGLTGFWDTLVLGQIYLPLALAAAGAWLMLERRQAFWAGLLIACLVSIKPNFLVWPVLLFLAGHRSVAGWAIAVTFAISIVPAAIFGFEIYQQWFELIAKDGSRAAFLSNASFPGLAARLGIPMLGLAVGGAGLLAAAVWALRRRPGVYEVSALALVLSLFASPIAWVHYTLFLLPVFFHYWRRLSLWPVASLLMVPVPFVLGFMGGSVPAQATIGSVYSWTVILLLGVLIWHFSRSPPETHHSHDRNRSIDLA